MYVSNSVRDFQNVSERDFNALTMLREHSLRHVKVLSMDHAISNSADSLTRTVHNATPAGRFQLLSDWKSRKMEFLSKIFPCIVWMRSYNWKEDLKMDIAAGLTVGTMIVPQSMSYARLAGLHPIYGLYSGFIPVITYALFGSSRQLAVGSVAMVSLLMSNGITPITSAHTTTPEEATQLYTELAIHLALLVGIIECVMGVIRLGWLIRFISHSVVSGFTTASAIIIGLSQAKSFLGYDITSSTHISVLIRSIIDGLDQFKWQPCVLGFTTLGLLLLMKHLGKHYKSLRILRVAGPLSAVVLGVIFVKLFRPASIAVVGEIPQGFPPLSLRYSFNFKYTLQLLPYALLVCGVGILESVGIAKALASKNGYELDSNQELFGLGVANLVGCAFSAYPVTGSFSRSAVSNESGAKSGLFGVVVFLVVGCALMFLTPAFTDIPQAALAAIVVSAVIGLVDYDEAIFLWQVDKRDLLLWMTTFVFTLLQGIEVGVLIGVGVSLVFVIYESANPHTALLGRLPGTTVYRNVEQYPEAYTYHGIVVIRVDAPIYFANIDVIKDRLQSCEHYRYCESSRGVEQSRIHFVVFEMSPVTYIDSSAVHALKELHENYKGRGVQMAICNPSRKVMGTLFKGGIPDLMGYEWYFVRVHDAVQTCLAKLAAKGSSGLTADVESQQEEETRDTQTRARVGDVDAELHAPLLDRSSTRQTWRH